MTLRNGLGMAALVVACVVASRAHAQDDARAHAIALFQSGLAHLADGDAEEAVTDFEEARQLYPTAPIHFNLGLAYREIGRIRDAIGSFERFLTAVGDEGDPAHSAEARRYLRTLRAALGRVRLDLAPEGATVAIDGRGIPRGTTLARLDPGTHQLTVSAPDHRTEEREVEVTPGSDQLVRLTLVPSVARGVLDLDITPDEAEVHVDGRPLGTGDRELTLEAGLHRVLLEYEGEEATREVNVLADQRVGLSLRIGSEGRSRVGLVLGLLALAVGGAAAGVGIWAARNPSEEQPLSTTLGTVTTALRGGSW